MSAEGCGIRRRPSSKRFAPPSSPDPGEIRALLDDPEFKLRFGGISGDKLKRVPPGFPPDHPEAELLKQKDLTFGVRLADGDVLSPALPDIIADSFAAVVPLMRYFARL